MAFRTYFTIGVAFLQFHEFTVILIKHVLKLSSSLLMIGWRLNGREARYYHFTLACNTIFS